MDFAQLRSKYKGFDDEEIISALQQTKYPEYSFNEVAAAVGYKPRTRGALEAVNDWVIEGANAAAGAVGSAANFVSPGNRISQGIDENIVKPGEAKQSDTARVSRRMFQEEVAGADGIGDELMAVGRKVVRDPILSAAQAVGSFVVPGAAVKVGGGVAGALGAGAAGVTRAGMAGGSVAGAALSGGDAAGTAYDLVIKAGGSEEEAQSAARQASVIPAVVGGAGGMLGAERLFAGGHATGGAVARALKTGASEALQEAFEEGITQYEGQRAAMPYDPSIDPTKGVAAAAGMGAALGGMTGAGVGAMTRPHAPAAPTEQAPTPIERAAPVLAATNVDDAIAAAAGAVNGGQSAAASEVMLPGFAPQTEERFTEAIPAGEATEIAMPAAELAPDQATFIDPIAQREADRPAPPTGQPEPGDILNPRNEPFVTMPGAMRALSAAGPDFEIKRVADGLVVRKKAEEPAQATDLLTIDSKPYGTRAGAQARANREGGEVVEVAGGFVVRQAKEQSNVEPELPVTATVLPGAGPVAAGQPEFGPGAVRPLADDSQRSAVPDPEPAGASGGSDLQQGRGGESDAALTVGSTFTLADKPWTVIEATDRMVKARDEVGTTKMIAVGSKTWGQIAPSEGASEQPPAQKTQASRGPAASEAWVNEGKTAEQLKVERARALGMELAGITREESSAKDFAPADLPNAIRMWAEEHRVAEEDLRDGFIKALDRYDFSEARKAQIRKAIERAALESSEQRLAPPVAESPSPRDRDSGDRGVAPTQEGGAPSPSQQDRQARHAEARRMGAEAGKSGASRDPPQAFTSLEKQLWRAGWDDSKKTKVTPQVERTEQVKAEPQATAAPESLPSAGSEPTGSAPTPQDKPAREQIEMKKRISVLNKLLLCMAKGT